LFIDRIYAAYGGSMFVSVIRELTLSVYVVLTVKCFVFVVYMWHLTLLSLVFWRCNSHMWYIST